MGPDSHGLQVDRGGDLESASFSSATPIKLCSFLRNDAETCPWRWESDALAAFGIAGWPHLESGSEIAR